MKAARVATTVGLSREDWLAIRRQGIGGSDLPAILGLSPFRTPVEVAAEKLGILGSEERETASMRRGRYLEDAVVRLWSAETGRQVQHVRSVLRSYQNPLMLANIDRRATRPEEIVEVKTAGLRGVQYWLNEDPPAYALLQLEHYLRVAQVKSGWIVSLVGGDLRWWSVELDDRLIDDAWSRATDWWDRYVRLGKLPGPSGAYADTKIVQALYATSEPGRAVDLPDDARQWLHRYLVAARDERDAKGRKDEAANNLRMMLGTAEVGLLDGEIAVTWRSHEVHRLDTDRIRTELPDVAARYTRVSVERRLLLAKEKGDKQDD